MSLNATVEIADDPCPIEDGGGYPWTVAFGSHDVTGCAVTRELAAKAVGLAIVDEQISRSLAVWQDEQRAGRSTGV